MKGHKLWTDDDREILRNKAPDYDALHKMFPHRTRIAIESQCRKMGLQKTVHIWRGAEISRLRKLYPRASREQICAEFPHSTWINIRQAAQYHGLRRNRKPFKQTGIVAVDMVLQKCFEANMSLPDLDKECRTKKYFQQQKWREKRPNYSRFAKAIEILDGELMVQWRDAG
ncbi:hypothetical protein LP421_07790 [Rhizobium sp. RCAM05350]|nr:hypothetical protein LP421_07790 [Rhizobium sp. RCAM05350]